MAVALEVRLTASLLSLRRWRRRRGNGMITWSLLLALWRRSVTYCWRIGSGVRPDIVTVDDGGSRLWRRRTGEQRASRSDVLSRYDNHSPGLMSSSLSREASCRRTRKERIWRNRHNSVMTDSQRSASTCYRRRNGDQTRPLVITTLGNKLSVELSWKSHCDWW